MKRIYLSLSLLIFTFTIQAQFQQIGFDINGEAINDYSGFSVSMSSNGNILAIGALNNSADTGHVRVYEWNSTTNAWQQKGVDIDGEAANDNSGRSISMSSDGNTLAISAPFNDSNGLNSGHTRVYEWNNTTNIWQQKGVDIDGEAAEDQSGWSVSISSDGNTLAIGAIFNDGNGIGSGHTRVYEWNNTINIWQQKGADIDGEAAGDQSGWSVSMSSDGNTVAIGAITNNGNAPNTGHTRIYTWNNTTNTWQQKGGDIDGEATHDASGSSISLSANGNTLAIGAPGNDGNGTNAGLVRVYEWNNNTNVWQQKGVDIDGEAIHDTNGSSISLSSNGNTLAIGAPGNDGNGTNAGHVRVYTWNNMTNAWQQVLVDIDGEAPHDASGTSISLNSNGNTLAIGAVLNDANGFNSGHARVYCIPTYSSDLQIACDSYTWIDGNTYTASNNIATHTLTNSAGCDSIVTLNLTINSTYFNNQNQSICQDDSILIHNTYQSTAGIYYDSLQTINGCDSVLSTTLGVDPLPNVILASFNPDTLCENGNVVVLPLGTPIGGNYSGSGIIGGDFDPTITGIGTHEIIYSYTDGNSCINSDTTIITVDVCAGINNISTDFGIIIYPIPSTGQFTIEKPNNFNKEVHVKLLDASSKLILERIIPIGKQKVDMDIRNYSKGLYYLQLIVDDQIFVKQILKN